MHDNYLPVDNNLKKIASETSFILCFEKNF